jgi:CelD/BcsL family acetyltransferase involved in cellulose biosynthesis
MTLSVERLTYVEAFEGLLPEWEALEALLSPRTPFTSPIWNKFWWKYFARQGFLQRDECFVHALRDDSGRLVAVAPLMRTYQPAFGPLRFCKLQFFGTDPSLTEIRGIICQAEREGEVVAALTDHFGGSNHNNWELFEWSGIRLDGEAYKRLASAGDIITRRTLPDYVISLPGSWEEFHSRLSNNTRKSLRKGYEFIDRDGHKIALRVTESPGEFGDALKRFFSLHKARARARDMKPHRDSFRSTKHRDFLNEIVDHMGARGLLRVLQLESGGEIIASRIGFALGKELYLYFSGYDPRWRKYGVMTTLMVETIKWAIEHGYTIINLSTGKDMSKLRWKPTEINILDVAQSPPSLRGKLTLRPEQWLRRHDRGDVIR